MIVVRVMKLLCFVLLGGAALAQDITFTNRTATFTNLEGRLFSNVTLVRASQDGVIWRDDSGGGQVSYTNLNPALLKEWGIPLERIEQARVRAGQKAVADAQRRAALAAQLAAQQAAQLEARRKAKEEWDAGAPARALEAQRQADFQAITKLEADIEMAEYQAEWLDAFAPKAAYGDAPVVETIMAPRRRANAALAEVKAAKRQLERMKAAYVEKYPTK